MPALPMHLQLLPLPENCSPGLSCGKQRKIEFQNCNDSRQNGQAVRQRCAAQGAARRSPTPMLNAAVRQPHAASPVCEPREATSRLIDLLLHLSPPVEDRAVPAGAEHV